MDLTEQRPGLLKENGINTESFVLMQCKRAAILIHNGQYEAAKEQLSGLWQGVGERPNLNGLDELASAEVLLQCGVLTGWSGSVGQVANSQEKAKDLIFESLRLFQTCNQTEKVAETKYELGMCYWREGAFDESRVVLEEALQNACGDELKAKILVRRTIVEVWTGRYMDAYEILKEAAPFLKSCDDALKGRWHGQMGLVMRRLAMIEGRADYFDKAIIEYTAAIYHYEQAGHERYCGNNLNNLAFLLYKLGRYKDAHDNLERAAKIFKRLNDPGNLAQVEETKARVLVAEGRFNQADYVITNAIRHLERGGESALLADALIVQGIVYARLDKFDRSICKLRDAIDTATYAGALHNAGLASLTLIEEHGSERLSPNELYDFYSQADEFLKDTQDFEEIKRLRNCAKIVSQSLHKAQTKPHGVTLGEVSLPDALHSFEAKLIEEALQIEGGSVSRAAKRLGIKHQSLAHLLNTRHSILLAQRTPIIKRKRSIIRLREPNRTAHCTAKTQTQALRILHVEDNAEVARVIKNIFSLEGWYVETCSEGDVALQRLESDALYDLIVLDNELPKINGIEVARRARRLAHRQDTPIVIFSANFDEKEALDAGADMILKKPEDTTKLITKIKSLITD